MSSIDPMLLLAGKQPRRRMVRIKREEPDVIGETEEEEESEEEPCQPPPQVLASPKSPHAASAAEAKPVKPSPYSKAVKMSQIPITMSLTDRCRTVIVAHLERYPPEALGVLDPEEWSTIISQKHAKTKPARGTGGLDGTGRLTPAVAERYISAVEEEFQHLATPQTDVLVWKDCVNYRFKIGRRPHMLEEPWPVMVQNMQALGETLEKQTVRISLEALQKLISAPMNVSLLQATGIGKKVKRVIKTIKQENQEDSGGCLDKLTRLLNKWKEIAASPSAIANEDDWKLAEECHSWRALYKGLKNRDESHREALGQRMRANRANLNAHRPAIVKVRPAKAQHERILNGGAGSIQMSTLTNPKLLKLRQESAAIAQRVTGSASRAGSSFSRAVAVAACAKRNAEGTSGSSFKRMRTAISPPPAQRRPAPFSRPPSSSGRPGAPKARPPAKKSPLRR